MNWTILNHNGNTGFGGCIASDEAKQGRVYPLTSDLWKWEIREIETRRLLFVGTTKTEEAAKAAVERFINRSCTKIGITPKSFFRMLWLIAMMITAVIIFLSIL